MILIFQDEEEELWEDTIKYAFALGLFFLIWKLRGWVYVENQRQKEGKLVVIVKGVDWHYLGREYKPHVSNGCYPHRVPSGRLLRCTCGVASKHAVQSSIKGQGEGPMKWSPWVLWRSSYQIIVSGQSEPLAMTAAMDSLESIPSIIWYQVHQRFLCGLLSRKPQSPNNDWLNFTSDLMTGFICLGKQSFYNMT